MCVGSPGSHTAGVAAADAAAADVAGFSRTHGGLITRLRAVFDSIDADASGEISRIELIRALRSRPDVAALLELPSVIRQEDGTRDSFERVFQDIDDDCSKQLSWTEFLVFVTARNARRWDASYDPPAEGLVPR
jgi:hypothetical protein